MFARASAIVSETPRTSFTRCPRGATSWPRSKMFARTVRYQLLPSSTIRASAAHAVDCSAEGPLPHRVSCGLGRRSGVRLFGFRLPFPVFEIQPDQIPHECGHRLVTARRFLTHLPFELGRHGDVDVVGLTVG